MVGFLLVLIAAVANIFLAIPAMSLAISAVVIMIMSGFILYDTSRIIHGGETNYVLATIGLYMTIFNIFISLLQILGIMGNDDWFSSSRLILKPRTNRGFFWLYKTLIQDGE